jgi:hypothetical protein
MYLELTQQVKVLAECNTQLGRDVQVRILPLPHSLVSSLITASST